MIGSAIAFEEACRSASGSLVCGERMRILWDTARACAPLGGAVIEVGVYRGGTAVLLRHAVPDMPLYLFDTFSGHPAPTPGVDLIADHYEGRYSDTDAATVASRFAGHANPPIIIAGRFPQSRAHGFPAAVCFAHVDVDIYTSTRDALNALWPMLLDGGAIVCDDYGFDECPGAKRAVQEFMASTRNAVLEELPTLQARIRKTGRSLS